MGKKTEYKFCVGASDEKRSSLWVLWIPNNKSDVYLTARPLGGKLKVSIHVKTGKCSISCQEDFWNKIQDRAKTLLPQRHMKTWRLKDFDKGVMLAFRLVVPTSELFVAPHTGLMEPDKVIWIPAAPPGKAIRFSFLLTDSGIQINPINKSGAKLVLNSTLANKHTLWVVYDTVDYPANSKPPIDYMKRKPVRLDPDEQIDFSDPKLRAVWIGIKEDVGCVIEIAYPTNMGIQDRSSA